MNNENRETWTENEREKAAEKVKARDLKHLTDLVGPLIYSELFYPNISLF